VGTFLVVSSLCAQHLQGLLAQLGRAPTVLVGHRPVALQVVQEELGGLLRITQAGVLVDLRLELLDANAALLLAKL
jgi:hypothetical protein